MQTLTEEEFKQRYGVIGLAEFESAESEKSLFESIKESLKERGSRVADISQHSGNPAVRGFEMAAETAGGISDVAGETLTRVPVVGGLLQKAGGAIKGGFDALTNKLGGTKFFQEAAEGLGENSTLESGLRIGSAGGKIAGEILGSEVGKAGLSKTGSVAQKTAMETKRAISDIGPPDLGGAAKYVKGAISDVIPSKQILIDENLAKGLDLTPTDLKNIEFSTGNSVGRFLADNNLIGTNKVTTQGLIKSFFDTNYKQVRSEIDKVKKTYSLRDVPRYVDALKQIKSQVEGVPGLEKEAALIDNYLNLGKPISLRDVQIGKELFDKHFSLYKRTGDVKEAVTKQGLANVRQELRQFIENEVKKETGADIRDLNNKVSTSREILDAIESRSTRGLTRQHFSTRDIMIGLGLTYFGSPLLGGAFLFLQKLITSPTARLRFARWLDQRSDAEKLKVSEALNRGEVPKEVQALLTKESSE